MTRINLIPPTELCGQHLIAEYRELPRVFALVSSAIERGETPDNPKNPKTYTLGTGHVRFFYSRLNFLVKRHRDLVKEMGRRGYKTNFTTDLFDVWKDIPYQWWGDYIPTENDIMINRERIKARMPSKPRFFND